MRPIKFRAKKHWDGIWVYGCYFYGYTYFRRQKEKAHYILHYKDDVLAKDLYCDDEIDEKTLGQYTGLNDKNGVEIYEGDIVDCENRGAPRFIIEFDNRWHGFNLMFDDACETSPMCSNNLEVIGNIYDNPELMKGEI